MSTFLQPPQVDLSTLDDERFLSPEEAENWQQAIEREAAEAEQKKFDDYERRRQAAQDKIRREREQAEIDGHLSEEAELFRDIRLRPHVAEAHDFEPTVRTPVVQGLFYQNSLSWVAGQSGTFKSFVTADLAFRYGTDDMDYHGKKMTHGRALLVIAEGAAGYADRKTAWEAQHGRQVKNVSIYPAPLQLGDTIKEMPALRSYLAEERDAGRPFDLIVFDTQAMCTIGVDENTSEMNLIVNVLHRIREVNGACVMVVHHFGKNKSAGMRGSSMIYAAADTVCVLKRKEDETTVLLSTAQSDEGKQKDGIAEKDLLALEMVAHPVGEDFFGDPVFSLVPVADDTPGRAMTDMEIEEATSLPDVTENQMVYLKLLANYEHRGATASDMAEKLVRERGPVKNARQNVRNQMVDLAKLEPSLAAQPSPRGPWFITPAGVGVIARQIALGENWVEYAGSRRSRKRVVDHDQTEVSFEVSGGSAKPRGETSETFAKPEAKPRLTSNET